MLQLRSRRGALAALFFAAAVQAVAAAPAPTEPPKLKGVLMPMHYTEDIGLTDVFFITPEIGWVAGDGNTILKTTDGGASWTAQLGGDPESPERAAREVFFLDERLGWAMMANPAGDQNLMHTKDGGENWIQLGGISGHYSHFTFLSERIGVIVQNRRILRTTDSGKSWKPVFECRAKLDIEGLPATVDCDLYSLSFVNNRVGFATGGASGPKGGVVARTLDGGESWQVTTVPYDGTAASDNSDILFIDENTGYARFGYSNGGELYRTTDGGATWTGITASVGAAMRFADPEVGWCLQKSSGRLSYTVDGGKRWSVRDIAFPVQPTAFSFPRRDTAYFVGPHGMIYRYRVVPESEPTPVKALAAPVMPSPAYEVLGEIAKFEADLAEIEDGIEEAAGAGSETSWAETPWPQEIAELQVTADSLATGVPELGRKYRNLNLVLLGLELLSELSNQGAALKQTFDGLRQAQDLESATAALADVLSQVEAMKTTAAAALQDIPAEIESTSDEAVSGGFEDLTTGDEAATAGAPAAAAASGSPQGQSPDAGAVRKKLKDKIRKFNPF